MPGFSSMARTTTRRAKTAAAEAAPVTTAPVAAAARPAGKLFSVTRSRGPAWDASLAMEQQSEWPAHAAFMDGLERQGFVVLGGPLEDTPYVMLAVRAESLEAARARLADDPWETARIIETTRIVAWTLRLGVDRI